MLDSISLRPRTPGDEAFLLHLYASTRWEELAPVPWTEDQKLAFLSDQFRLQTHHYEHHYPGAQFLVIERDGQAIGRLYLHRGSEDLLLMDIALVPSCRGKGLGTALLERLLREAGSPVTCHVEFNNPALRLYQRLGFRKVEERGVYFFMEWKPG